MAEVRNGIPAAHLTRAVWRVSSHSGKQGNCVHIAHLTTATTAVRDSKNPLGPVLAYPASGTMAFLIAVKDGVFHGPGA
jgi:hypothetical protein